VAHDFLGIELAVFAAECVQLAVLHEAIAEVRREHRADDASQLLGLVCVVTH
jgi:hypothetical protein